MVQYGSVRKAPVPLERRKPWKNRLLVAFKTLVILFVVISFAILSISIYVGWSLTHPDRRVINESPLHYNLLYDDIEVESRVDGVRLSGWQIETEAEPRGVIIFSHGYGMNRLQKELPALALAKEFVEANYHAILFDYRNSGESEGTLTSIGYYEQGDLLSVVDYAKRTFPELPIGVIGFSMGAATAIVAAEQDTTIQAVVADSPFADLREYLEGNLPHWSNLPAFPFTPVILKVVPKLTGIEPEQVSPREAIANMDTPHLLIHGEADEAIPYQESEQIAAYGGAGHVSLWIVPEAGHVYAYATSPEEYTDKVLSFFNQHLSR